MTLADVPFIGQVLFLAQFVPSTALCGMAALWAVSGPVKLIGRWSPILLLLAATAPIGAYELSALFGMQAAVVIGGMAIVRFVARHRARSVAKSISRFRLIDLLKAVLLVAAVLAIVRNAAPATTAMGPIQWGPWIVWGMLIGSVIVASAWLACGNVWLVPRVATLFLVLVAGGPLATFLTEDWQAAAALFSIQSSDAAFYFLAALSCSVVMLLLLWLARRAGWNCWPRAALPVEESAPLLTDYAASQHPRWAARAAVAGILFCFVSALSSPYLALLPPAIPEPTPLPANNGFDDLVQAGNSQNWTSIPNGDYNAASPQQRAAFVVANAAVFSTMRAALSRPCQAPVDFTGARNSTLDFQPMRSLCHALEVEALSAIDEGRFADAAQSYLDMHRLANVLSTRRLGIYDLVSNAIAATGSDGLSRNLHSFDAPTLALITQRISEALQAREPMEKVLAENRIYVQLELGWLGRLMNWRQRLVQGDWLEHRDVEARNFYEANAGLLVAEAGVRQFALDHGTPPASLTELVPNYLANVPRDPFVDGPLAYCRTAEGYLLYSVSSNRMDDGGQRVTYQEVQDGKGDLFFDDAYRWHQP